jgi:DNA transformation protein and related proteins
MKHNSEFHDYVVRDLMEHIPHIASRRMFGGYGIYYDGIFFALIAEGALYFKVDVETVGRYTALGSSPFRYSAKDRGQVTLSYYEVPEEIREERETLEEWVEDAVAAAKRSKKKKSSKK